MNRILLVLLSVFSLSGCAEHNASDQAESLCRIAHKARLSGNPESAIKFYTRVIEVYPGMAKAYLGLSESYIDIKLLDAAESNLKKAEVRGANKSRIGYLRGKCYLLRGNLQAAKREFLKFPNNVDCMNALGAVYDNQGRHEQAQALYKQVIAINPKYIDAYNNLGLSLMLSDNYKDAIFYLENACTLPEANSAYRGNLALAYGLSGQLAKARAVYAQDYDGDELEERVAYLEAIISNRK